MNFKEYYFTEVKASPRKGIKHLYNDNSDYSMNPSDFLEIIQQLKTNKGKLDAKIANISEKQDGFKLNFGISPDNRFYIESSKSGPVYDTGKFRQFTIDKRGKSDDIAEGYEDILKELVSNERLQKYLKSVNMGKGIKIHCEAFYMPLGKDNEDSSMVKFVATWYRKERLGDWATFIILNITDGQGESIDNVEDIKDKLIDLSDDRIKFGDAEIEFNEVDLSKEIYEVDDIINNIEQKFGKDIDDILKNNSRKRDSLVQKREVKEEIFRMQKLFSDKLKKLLGKSKFGDESEGIVIQMANDIVFKVVSDRFKEAKKEYNR